MEFLNSPSTMGKNLPLSLAVRVRDILYISGMVGIIPGTFQLAAGGLEGEARQTMDNIGAILKENGLAFHNVFKKAVIMADISKLMELNKLFLTYFRPDRMPASSTFGGALAFGAQVEVECWAFVGKS